MKLSSGAKKDFLVINFAKSMIEVSNQDSSIEDEDLKSRVSNKNYRENKRIDSRLDNIREKLQTTTDAVYEEGGRDTAEWIQKNLQKRIGKTLTSIQIEKINLEMLALWVLYTNFSELERPLHEQFKWAKDGNQFLEIIDLMEKTEIGFLNKELFNASYEVIAKIKG